MLCRSDEEKYGRSRRTNSLCIIFRVEMYKASGQYVHERILEIQLKVFGSECNLIVLCVCIITGIVWNDKVYGK